MLSLNTFLAACELLKERGYKPRFEPGMRIARGFADLGYEEYYVLPGDKMVSLFTGTQSSLPSDHAKFFFTVPHVDELLEYAAAQHIKISSLQLIEERLWEINFQKQDGRPVIVRDRDLATALVRGLCEVLSESNIDAAA